VGTGGRVLLAYLSCAGGFWAGRSVAGLITRVSAGPRNGAGLAAGRCRRRRGVGGRRGDAWPRMTDANTAVPAYIIGFATLLKPKLFISVHLSESVLRIGTIFVRIQILTSVSKLYGSGF
jgi:hypothetical protein